MKILTWNVNGLRSLGPGESLNERFKVLDADIICIQETKVTRDMLEESAAVLDDFTSYFSFSRKRSGYSGVATYCRAKGATPNDSKEGLAGVTAQYHDHDQGQTDIELEFSKEELKELDAEGRAVLTWHKLEGANKCLVVINVYCPRADPERADRLAFKLRFYKLLEMRSAALVRAGNHVVIVGDVNTSHRPIDHCDPYEDFESQPGRQWLDHFLHESSSEGKDDGVEEKADDDDDDALCEWKVRSAVPLPGGQFVDAFRRLHPDRKDAFTCWNTKMNCRATNYGTRIDYVFVDQALAEKIRDCEIHPDVPDSDHCPVTAEIGVFLVAAEKCPLHCSKNFPEFSGKQQKVSEFFMSAAAVKRTSPNPDPLPAAKKYKQQQQAKQQTMLSFFQAKSAKSKPASTLCQEKAVIAPSDIDKDFGEEIERRSATASAWKTLFKGPPATPNCRGHNEPSVLRTVKKKGANAGRQFWCCGRGEGRVDDPNARCDFFKWTK